MKFFEKSSICAISCRDQLILSFLQLIFVQEVQIEEQQAVSGTSKILQENILQAARLHKKLNQLFANLKLSPEYRSNRTPRISRIYRN